MLFKRVFLLVLCTIGLLSSARTQTANLYTDFQRITVNNGLSHSDVNAIVQDKDGFIWFGTYNGLCKYDGNKMLIYRTDNSKLSNNRILALYVGSDSLLYIGMEMGGLAIYDPQTDIFTCYKHDDKDSSSLASDVIHHIFEDEYKNRWVCTDRGISKMVRQEGKSTFINSVHVVHADGIILSGIEYDSRRLLLATNHGLALFDRQTSKAVPFLRTEIDHLVRIIIRKDEQTFLIGTTQGLFEYNKYVDKLFPICDLEVLSIFVDHKRQVWVGSIKDGLHLIDQLYHSLSVFQANQSTPNSISSNEVSSLFIDRSGILWAGTIGGGISMLNTIEKKIERYNIYSNVNGNRVPKKIITFAEDKNGLVWIGTKGNGIELMDRKRGLFTNLYDRTFPISLTDVSAFFQDKHGAMWVGTWKGLYMISPETVNRIWNIPKIEIKPIGNALSYTDNSIYKIVEDQEGHLWISTSNGVYEYIPDPQDYYKGTFRQYKHDPADSNAIQDDFVTDIYVDKDAPVKTIWVGTRKGLSKFTFQQGVAQIQRIYPDGKNGLRGEFISVIHQDSKKRLWIVTLGGGLHKLVKGRYENTALEFERYDKSKYPFANNELESLLEDKYGNFWIGGYGITKFNPDKGETRWYGIKDKLQSNSFKIWSTCLLRSGEMVFGGVDGFNIFHPDSVKANPIVPHTVLTGLKIFSRDIRVGDTIHHAITLRKPINKTTYLELPYNHNSITLEFAALHFTSSVDNQYRYKLEGFDKEWYTTDGSKAYASYTNLVPGEYRFIVYGANSDGVWSDVPAVLEIKITPPFWKTTIAYIVYVLLFFALLYLVIRTLIHQSEQRHRLEIERTMREEEQKSFDNKLKFFTNISHEIKTPLSLISVPVEDLLMTPHIGNTTRSKLNLANRNIERLTELVEQILDFGKYESQMMQIHVVETDIVLFVQELAALFKPLANRKKIRFSNDYDVNSPMLYLDRDKMEKVISNLLSNALKFTPVKGTIRLQLTEDEYAVYLSVQDSGKGIDSQDLERIFEPFYQSGNDNHLGGTGIGLSLSKYIIDQHHGEIWAEANAQKGLTLHVKLRKDKNHFEEQEVLIEAQETEIPATPHEEEEITAIESEHTSQQEGMDFTKSATILVTEDNREFRQYIAEILTPDYHVLQAEHGAIAYEMAIAEQPDLIITDIVMPEMNGIELCDKIKNDMATSHISVMILTARDMLSYKIDGYETGADAYITKPFNLRLFRSRVNNLILANQRMKSIFRTQINVEPSEITVSTFDQKLIQKCLDVIEKNMQHIDFSVDDLCNEVGISRPQLYRKIKSLLGLSPVQFIRSIRLKRAAQILSQDDSSVSEVMYSVGFNNLSYFSKVFKEEFGCLPKQYKNSHNDLTDR